MIVLKGLFISYILIAANITTAGTPKANGKQLFLPKQWTSALNIGVIMIDNNAAKHIAKKNNEKYEASCRACCGKTNWSPPNGATQAFIPPVPKAIKNNAKSEISLDGNPSGSTPAKERTTFPIA